MFQNDHFLLSKVKGKVKAKFIGKIAKESKKQLPKQLWVPKALVTHVQGPKLIWIPKTQKMILICVGQLQSRWKTLGT